MITNTSAKIIEYVRDFPRSTAKDLIDHLGISRQALYKHLSKLVDSSQITKIGTPPKVYYSLFVQKASLKDHSSIIDSKSVQIIEKEYLYITPQGDKLEGVEGFRAWCDRTGQNPTKTALEYVQTLSKYRRYAKRGLINGLPKFESTFPKVHLDKILYLDFYSIERFGKTKLGQLLLYAKQSQDRRLIKELIENIRPKINDLIVDYQITSLGFIPPTVKREVQFMKELETHLQSKISSIDISKVRTPVIIPQKTLPKLEDRITNAHNTIVVTDTGYHDNTLLIDDAVGSGATLNETAKQIRQKGICKGKIIGLAITGSYKGFDVISEV